MMRRLIECADESGLMSLMGQQVTLLCGNYFYTGKLVGVNTDDVVLADPKIIYETGAWDTPQWEDAQALPTKELFVRVSSIESYGVLK